MVIGVPELIIILMVFVIPSWLFYRWGASVAERKGQPRSYGWLAALFWFLGLAVLFLMPYAPTAAAPTAAPTMKRFCSQCGATITGTNFCSACGAQV